MSERIYTERERQTGEALIDLYSELWDKKPKKHRKFISPKKYKEIEDYFGKEE